MEDPYLDTIKSMGRDVYDRMLNALATGLWPDGKRVSSDQRAHCMRAVIAWGELNLPPEERIGYIDKGHKADDVCDEPTPLKWQSEEGGL